MPNTEKMCRKKIFKKEKNSKKGFLSCIWHLVNRNKFGKPKQGKLDLMSDSECVFFINSVYKLLG